MDYYFYLFIRMMAITGRALLYIYQLIVLVSFFIFQHFVCAKCEKPFLGHRHYERKGLAYCETHYNQVKLARVSLPEYHVHQ